MLSKILFSAGCFLLLVGCGHGETTAYRANFYTPADSMTLAQKNRHDLLASTQLETGILYKTPDTTSSGESSEASDSETESSESSDTTASQQ